MGLQIDPYRGVWMARRISGTKLWWLGSGLHNLIQIDFTDEGCGGL